jgi:uncharacterized protein
MLMKKFRWHGQTFWLHPHRLLFWEEEKILIGSDLHLGKIGHFRKAGIALPQQVYKEDLHRLFAAFQYFQPKQFLVVGDMFHSKANKELDWFARWRNDFAALEIVLIRGNHDILSEKWYIENGIQVCPDCNYNGLRFIHDPAPVKSKTVPATNDDDMPDSKDLLPTISGHIHPGIRFDGFARQTVNLPCFYFSPTQCILPAFSLFTGLYTMKPSPGDDVFVLLNDEILQLGKK